MAALLVVLPTPPLPEVTTRILAKVLYPKYRLNGNVISQNGGFAGAVCPLKLAAVSVKGG